jgi:hypothetical protein
MTKTEKEDLAALADRLAAAQRELILNAAKSTALPSDKALGKIADLEVVIGAVQGLIDDERA